MGARVLVVDDEKNILATLSRALRVEGYEVEVAGNAAIALDKLASKAYDVLLLDVLLPDMDGIQVLKKLRADEHDVPVLVMSGHGTIDTAVEATRLGAHDFLEKPIGTERLLLSIARCLEYEALESENRELRQQTGTVDALLGDSQPMRELRERIGLAASASAPVLIAGERGTGKELVARAIHAESPRASGPLEKLNCAAVPSELIESELFGHEAGAFTGATKQRRGKFERAHGGTMFLDEIGDMPASMQAKLLRVLQEGEIERVGGNEVVQVDVRMVAASNKELRREIEEGRFRADLFDRLDVVPLRVPPLREHREDIPMLAEAFLEQACAANDRGHKSLSSGAIDVLCDYDYPGNVRELRNLIERLVILTAGDEITEHDARALLPIAAGGDSAAGFYQPGKSLREMMEAAERELVARALEHHRGHITNTAAALGLERSHLYKKMKALGIRRESD